MVNNSHATNFSVLEFCSFQGFSVVLTMLLGHYASKTVG